MGGLVEGCVGRWVGLPMTLATHMRHDEDLPGTLRLKYDEVKKNLLARAQDRNLAAANRTRARAAEAAPCYDHPRWHRASGTAGAIGVCAVVARR